MDYNSYRGHSLDDDGVNLGKESPLLSIEGNVEEIIYNNEVNGYTVARVKGNKGLTTIVGFFPYLTMGETYRFEGNWQMHQDYGQQFKVDKYSIVTPSTEKGIEKYLSSGLIPGIGPKTAKRLVDKFGVDTLDIIQYNPSKLTEVEGIGESKAQRIAAAFVEQRELKDIMMFLQNYNIGPSYSVKIYKKYGSDTINKVKENPYSLCEEITGIGFKTADSIAKAMGIASDSKYRIAAGVKYVLGQANGRGHTYLPQQELIKECIDILSVDGVILEQRIKDMVIGQKLIMEEVDGVKQIYSLPFYYAEVGVCRRMVELILTDVKEVEIDVDQEIRDLERKRGIDLAENQKKAIKEVMANSICVVTGGPGTGKTTTINSIIQIFEDQEFKVILAAPTGRAAKRMTETTGRESKTIHRLLEYGYFETEEAGGAFYKDESNPIEADVVIVDEVSMVDILLMNSLLKAISPGTRLILVGDVDQLPSVGAGNVLRDIISSGIVKVITLNEIFRQAKESMIVVNAHKINSGEYPTLNQKGKDFFFMSKDKHEEILDTIISLCKDRLPAYNGYHPTKDIQVITPMRKGVTGVLNINQSLQNVLNPKHPTKDEKKFRDMVFRVGDKVMQIKNNYNIPWERNGNTHGDKFGQGVFNGDVGYIQAIDEEEQTVTVLFDDDKLANYDFGQLDELDLAYGVTVHKSQGSEFPVVIMAINWGPPMLLTRNLLYTAVTRAKSLVVLVGKEEYLKTMVDNNFITQRYSGLDQKLRKIFNMVMLKLQE